MSYRFCLAAVLTLATAASASAQGQQKLQLSLDPDKPATTAAAPACSNVSGNYALVDDNDQPFGTVVGSETKGTWHLSGNIDGVTVDYRSNWACDGEFVTVYTKASTGTEGPDKLYVVKYDDGSVGLEYDEADGSEAFIGYLDSR